MAKITTITNPLTGQPAQVDQLDHTAQEIDDGIGFESTDYPGCYYRLVNGVVEWVNPPMQLGKEYRTIKRYRGKPIYTMSVDCKTGPTAGNNTSTYIAIGETVAAENVLSVKGFAEGGFTLPPGSNYTSAGVYIVAKPSVGTSPKNQITVNVASAVDYSSQHIYAVIEYTKTA